MLSLISCRSGTFRRRRLRSIKNYELCPKYWNEKLDKKTARKREISGGWELKTPALLLYFESCSDHCKSWNGAQDDAHTCDTIDIERENINSFSSLRSLTFDQFEVLTSTETSFLQLAERKLFPILLIGVVWTCVTYATKKGAFGFRIVAPSRKSRPWLA